MPNRIARVRWLIVGVVAAGCTENAFLDGESPVSSTIVVGPERALYAVNVDEGSVSRLDIDSHEVDTLALGSEPTRITRGQDRMYVTLRGQREVVSLVDQGNGIGEDVRAKVGAEPYGVVASPGGGPVYVALSLENRVVELDPETLAPIRSWEVADEPRWLALHAGTNELFVSSHRNGRLSRIDLDTGDVTRIPLPEARRLFFQSDGTTSGTVSEEEWALDIRLTGDPCITPDGEWLAVPALYVDTVALIPDSETELEALQNDGGSGGGYGGGGAAVSRMNPSLVLIPTGYNEQFDGQAVPVFTVGDDRNGARRTSITSAFCAPSGRHVLASMESADTVLVVDIDDFSREPSDRFDEPGAPEGLGFQNRPTTDVATDRGPRGIAFFEEGVWVHTWIGRRIAAFSWEDALEVNAFAANDTRPDQYPVLEARNEVQLVESVLTEAEQEGRDLFTTALDRRMTAHNGGVSCSTCHVDGREDGLSWPFVDGPRQTLSLAGGAAETGPFTWNGTVDSIGAEALRTTTLRMGGTGLDARAQSNLEAWIATFRAPDTPDRGRDDAIVAEGRALFESAEVGCASCHSGATLTDGQNHVVHGITPTNTPSLRGIAATAPYRHDGSLGTLRDVLDWAKTGVMGDTSSLDEAQLQALEAYLRTL